MPLQVHISQGGSQIKLRFNETSIPKKITSGDCRLTGLALLSRFLDEAVVERQVVPYRVLPALFVVVVVGEILHNEFVDPIQGDLLFRCAADRHGDQSDVTAWRFSVDIRYLLRPGNSRGHD